MKIGLFFGSFNPIHIGHALIARYALENFKLKQVWFVVSPHNPLKSPEDFDFNGDVSKVDSIYLSSISHRFQMVNNVCKEMSNTFEYSPIDLEYSLPKPSYTCDTLRHLMSLDVNKRNTFHIIMGSDCLHQIHKWKDYEYILENFPILVYPRPGTDFPPENIDSTLYDIREFKQTTYIDLSSTIIRDRIKNKKSIFIVFFHS